jgi:hypothetical protein
MEAIVISIVGGSYFLLFSRGGLSYAVKLSSARPCSAEVISTCTQGIV